MLGWSPEAAMTTPFPLLQLALRGGMEWELRRNGQHVPEDDAPHPDEPPDRETLMNRIKKQMRSQQAAQTDPRAKRSKHKRKAKADDQAGQG